MHISSLCLITQNLLSQSPTLVRRSSRIATVHRAYHRAPLECGDGAGDGPRKASAVTSPVYAGRQDPAKKEA